MNGCPNGSMPLNVRAGERVLIIGGYGVRNVGDEAILSGLLQQLPRDARPLVVSRDPADTASLHGVRAIAPQSAPAALLRADAVLIGGGGLFSGHMGPLSRWLPLFGLSAMLRGARVYLCSIGVYPSTPGLTLGSLAFLARRANGCSVRDEGSRALLNERHVKAALVDDLSMYMSEASPDRGAALLHAAGLDPTRPVVGLALTTADGRDGTTLIKTFARLVEQNPDLQFCFIPMSRHPKVPRQNDLLLATRVRGREPRIAVLAAWRHPSEILAVFANLSAVIAMRYHGLLFGARAGVPVIPIPYAEKCDDWLRTHRLTAVPLEVDALHARLADVVAASSPQAGAAPA